MPATDVPTRWATKAACLALAAGAVFATSAIAGDPIADKVADDAPYTVINGEKVPVPNIRMGDPATIEKILHEGKNNNQVMKQLEHLCTAIGPRLTGSANVEMANRWALSQFQSWGMKNGELFQWGEIPVRFDRGPSTAKVVIRRGEGDEISYADGTELAFTTLAWAPGTNGIVQGQVLRLPKTMEELEAVEDQLEGAWILLPSNPNGRRGVRGPAANTSARLGYFKELRTELKENPIADASASEGYVGRWRGTTTGPGTPPDGAEFVLDISSMDDKGNVTGTLSYPEANHSEPLVNAKINKATGQFTFTWDSPMGETVTPTWSLINGVLTARDSIGGGEYYLHVGKRTAPQTAQRQQRQTSATRFASNENQSRVAGTQRNPYSGTWEGLTRGGPAGNEGMPFVLKVDVDREGNANGRLEYTGFGAPFTDGKVDMQTGLFTCKWESPMGAIEWGASLSRDGNLSGSFADPRGGSDTVTQTGGRVSRDSGLVQTVAQTTQPEADDNAMDLEREIYKRIISKNPAGWVSTSSDDRVWTSSVRGWRELNFNDLYQDTEIIVNETGFDYINSKLTDGWPIELAVDADNRLVNGPFPVYDTIAEIPGTEWPDEVVIVSAHLDSWNGPGSRGTVDNGTGSSVTIEAARILTAVGAKPKRTIRFILWTGEEQGLLGSRGYVESLSDEERAKIVACFVDDGGTNYEGGIQCIESMRDYLAAATAPTNGQFFSQTDYDAKMNDDNPDNDERAGWMDVNVQVNERMPRGGGSDHASFNSVGIPGFFWDEVGRANYRYGWHTQYDRLDQAIEEYLIQSSTNAAIAAYNIACAPEMLPREIPEEENGRAGQ
ncbi:MAG: M20/M25/M40 family metallo-hydrolase [Phycisphaeraceae bacterium]|nr:M20/M25/M40 family metallo-hydrolase [Phycisphaerales bacterium]MCB9860269.1 M20/M25/M40 family metallo-hydrolase [Phycisphaeraceae bacterium]